MEAAGIEQGHGTCGAKTRSGGLCGKPAGWGTPVKTGRCKLHGGATPSHVKAAEKQQAVAAVATYGLPRDVEPHTALLEELHRTAGHVAWLATVVADLEQDDLTHLVVANEGRDDNRLEVIDERTNEFVKLYQQERKHLTAVAKTCIDVGIEERRVRVVEQWGEGIAAYTRALLARLGVDIEAAKTREAVSASLTLIQGGAPAA